MTAQYRSRHVISGWLGSALLAIGGLLHLALGYPALVKGISSAHLELESGIKAVWIALGLCFVFFAGIGFAEMRSAAPSQKNLLLVGGAALSNAVLVLWLVRQPTHPAVVIFGLAAILLLFTATGRPRQPSQAKADESYSSIL